jgi:hypothetical protein
MSTKSWDPGDVVGGPVDAVLSALRQTFADLRVERLEVTHPADDDYLWFISRSSLDGEVQLESAPGGRPPFLLESDYEREQTDDVDVAVGLLQQWLLRSR